MYGHFSLSFGLLLSVQFSAFVVSFTIEHISSKIDWLDRVLRHICNISAM